MFEFEVGQHFHINSLWTTRSLVRMEVDESRISTSKTWREIGKGTIKNTAGHTAAVQQQTHIYQGSKFYLQWD